MKHNVKKIFALLISLCLILASSMTVFAADTNGEFNAEKYAAEELNTWAEENGIGVRFENFHITPINDNISDAEIEASVRSYVEMMKTAMDSMSIRVTPLPTTRSNWHLYCQCREYDSSYWLGIYKTRFQSHSKFF